jgi:hypothetical protein
VDVLLVSDVLVVDELSSHTRVAVTVVRRFSWHAAAPPRRNAAPQRDMLQEASLKLGRVVVDDPTGVLSKLEARE